MRLPLATVKSPYGSRTVRNYMQDGEQELLLSLITLVQPYSMIEFGVNEGLTALAVLDHFPYINRYVGVDVAYNHVLSIPAQQVEVPKEPAKYILGDPRFELIFRGSDDSNIKGKFDVAFIDGDHGFEAVIKDYWLARQLVSGGGMIIFHDYLNPSVQVTEALETLYKKGKRDIYQVPNSWLAFEWV